MQTSLQNLDFPERYFTINQNPFVSYKFDVLKCLGKGKIKVYLVHNESRLYAMKYFEHDSELFQIESRFLFLSHPNIGAPIYAGAGASQHWKTETCVQIRHFSLTLSPYFPHGDFDQLLVDKNIELDEKLVRTYFHQLVSAITYMHKNNTAHTDIKLGNLMIDQKFQLKVIDFDLSYMEGDERRSGGCKNFRAPEVLMCDEGYDPYRADIFSMGIVLFALLAKKYPFPEDCPEMMRTFYESPETYWTGIKPNNTKMQGGWSESFKKLFAGMTRNDPQDRMTLNEIKSSKWYKGVVYEPEELEKIMRKEFENKGYKTT